jgi:Transmembrane secretion effector
MIALVQASTALPVLLPLLTAGALADSFDRRKAMLEAQGIILTVSVGLIRAASTVIVITDTATLGSGHVTASKPKHDGCSEGYGGEEDLGGSVVSGGNTSPALQSPEHDLDPVAALVVQTGPATRRPGRDASLYAFVFQRFSEPIGVMASISQRPLRLRQAAQRGRSAGMVADLACGHEEADRLPIGIGIQLAVHAALCATDQKTHLVTCPPVFDRRLEPRHLRLRQPEKVAPRSVSLQRLNLAASE